MYAWEKILDESRAKSQRANEEMLEVLRRRRIEAEEQTRRASISARAFTTVASERIPFSPPASILVETLYRAEGLLGARVQFRTWYDADHPLRVFYS